MAVGGDECVLAGLAPRLNWTDLVDIPFAPVFGGHKLQRIEPVPAARSGEVELNPGDFITFRVTNRTPRERYFYLIDLTPKAAVQAFFPAQGFDDNARVASGRVHIVAGATVQVNGPRDSSVWFMTNAPVNVWALEGQEFEPRPRGHDSTLARLLRQAGGLTRGTPTAARGASAFAAGKLSCGDREQRSLAQRSSLLMVPWPRLRAMVAFDGLPRWTKNVSLLSLTVSEITVIGIVRLVVPGGKVSTPLAAT